MVEQHQRQVLEPGGTRRPPLPLRELNWPPVAATENRGGFLPWNNFPPPSSNQSAGWSFSHGRPPDSGIPWKIVKRGGSFRSPSEGAQAACLTPHCSSELKVRVSWLGAERALGELIAEQSRMGGKLFTVDAEQPALLCTAPGQLGSGSRKGKLETLEGRNAETFPKPGSWLPLPFKSPSPPPSWATRGTWGEASMAKKLARPASAYVDFQSPVLPLSWAVVRQEEVGMG